MINEINEHREKTRQQKEAEILKNKEEDLNYINDYKIRMKQLEDQEKEELKQKKLKERDLAEYQKLQFEEKRRQAVSVFEQLNEDAYQNFKRLEAEDDDFMKYAEYKIQEYHNQGKNVLPLLTELKRYKKNYSLK